MEIGSIYEINPDFLVKPEEGKGGLPSLKETEKYHKKYLEYTASGREAILLSLKSLEISIPQIVKKCLLPAYMCDTVFFPFEKAGWEIHFYHIGKNLEAEVKDLCSQIEYIRPGLLFVHCYYGVDTWKPMRSLLKEWRESGIYIMEDVTQSYFLQGAGKEADMVIGSLRKWYAVPDGGFAASDIKLCGIKKQENSCFTNKKVKLLTDKWDYLYGVGSKEEKKKSKELYLKENRETEEWLDAVDSVSAVSAITCDLLIKEKEEEAKEKRNRNYRLLYEGLQETEGIAVVYERFYEEASPLYFPIYASDRDSFQKYLGEHDIYAPVLWPVGKENEAILSDSEKYIYEHLLALPLDQRYGTEEMLKIIETANSYRKPVIGIRADANEEIASGHMMRCITIAKKLKEKGSRIIFFLSDEYSASMLKSAGFSYICLHTEWNNKEGELPILKKELKKAGCKKLLIDSYEVTADYLKELRKECKIIYIDDMFEEIYPADMIINYNAYHINFPYEVSYGKNTKLLLGTSYVPLRQEFAEAEKKTSKTEGKRQNVLLSSGGGDACNALTGILEEAMISLDKEDFIFHVIVGKFNSNTRQLEALAKQHPGIELHYNINNMAELMGICDMAVSAAGTVLFELSAMQVPTIFFVSADNQKYDSDFFAEEERMLFAGDIRTEREDSIRRICDGFKELIENRPLQEQMKRKLHEVTDGNGALRIAEEIIAL